MHSCSKPRRKGSAEGGVQNRNVNVAGKKYDVHVFEALPLFLKASVFKNYIVVLGDAPEIGEYFYFYRKLWKDQEHRQRLSDEEVREILGLE